MTNLGYNTLTVQASLMIVIVIIVQATQEYKCGQLGKFFAIIKIFFLIEFTFFVPNKTKEGFSQYSAWVSLEICGKK